MDEKHKIVVIEDEAILANSLAEELKDNGFAVSLAFDGVAGLALCLEEKPDLILLDLLIPKQDGFAVITALRANPEWSLTPIIVLSNFGRDTEIKRALEIGADDYFVKSQHSLKEIVERVKEYLNGKRVINVPVIGT